MGRAYRVLPVEDEEISKFAKKQFEKQGMTIREKTTVTKLDRKADKVIATLDKGGKTEYLHTIVKAFLDGRKLLTSAKGEKLTDAQRAELKGYAKTIADTWQRVLAEATFKYAGEVYEDMVKLQTIMEANGETEKMLKTYIKHWGELKGFALALQTGGRRRRR